MKWSSVIDDTALGATRGLGHTDEDAVGATGSLPASAFMIIRSLTADAIGGFDRVV